MVTCRHCGVATTAEFCCAGCAAAHAFIQGCGLGEFHRRRNAVAPAADPEGGDADAQAYAGEAFVQRFTVALDGGDRLMRWRIAEPSCPACVWLLEQLPRLLPGVTAARVDAAAGLLLVRYRDDAPPAAQAGLLARLGWRVRPDAGDGGLGRLRDEGRALAARTAVAAVAAVAAMHLALNLQAGEFTADLARSDAVVSSTGALAAALVAAAAAWPLWRSAWRGFRARSWNADATAALVTLLGLGASTHAIANASHATYADAVALFLALLLAARLVLHGARLRVARAGGALDGLLPELAERVTDGDGARTAVSDLRPGDRVRVQPGAVIPCDGVLASAAAVDAAVLTGEAMPVTVPAGGQVHAGCRLAGSAPVELIATATGAATRLGGLVATLDAPRPVQRRPGPGELAMRWSAPVILLLAAAAWWWLRDDPRRALDVAIGVALVACPCALALAAPLARALAARRAAAHGILLRDPAALHRLAVARTIALDKTGTLTIGVPTVTAWELAAADGPAVLGAVAQSRHPAALAIARHLRARGVVAAPSADHHEIPGSGIVSGDLAIGGERLIPGAGERTAVARDGRIIGWFALDDPLRPELPPLIAAWRAAGIRVLLLSGDHPARAARIAALAGIAEVHGGMAPEAKAAAIAGLDAVAVGDGANDLPMLAAAGTAIGSHGGVAAGAAACDAYLADPARAGLPALWSLARALRRRERLLVAVAIAYNAAAVGCVLAGWWGPLVCAISMPLSSATVAVLAGLPLTHDNRFHMEERR